MGVYAEVKNNAFLRGIRDSGLHKGMERLSLATPDQIQNWAKLVLTMDSLEAVLGKR